MSTFRRVFMSFYLASEGTPLLRFMAHPREEEVDF